MKERVGDERLIIISVTVSSVNDRITWASDCYIDPWGPHLQSGSLIGHSHTQSPVRCFVSGGCKSHKNLEVSNVTCWHSAWNKPETSTDPYSHTHTHLFNGPLSGTTRVSRYQKGKTSLDFTEARDSEWQWHQLGHMQVCTSLQTNNHASTQFFYRPDALPAAQPTASKHWPYSH